MKLMKIIDDETYEEVKELWLDGYDFGERLLEGLPVKVTLNPEGTQLQISASWPKGMDSEYWTRRALGHLRDTDNLSTVAHPMNDDGFIDFEITSD
jgi:hypothetical protein